MSKIVSLLLSFALILGLAGCGAEKTEQLDIQSTQQQGQSVSSAPVAEDIEVKEQNEKTDAEDEFSVSDAVGEAQDFSKYEEVKKDKYLTEPVPEGQQAPVEPGDMTIDRNNQKNCYLSISCSTILDNMDDLREGKEVLVPSDGLILPQTQVTFYEGESVFDVLQRETRGRQIHMESTFTPIYNSAYIEGIGNLYEFDCGSDSGWLYRVNGWFPNYGVSRYALQQGDVVEFIYTCDLGRDVGKN